MRQRTHSWSMSHSEWTRDEHLVVLDLYLNHPEIVEDTSDPVVQEVADLIDRSSNSVVLRLGNYRYLDPQSTKGLSNLSKGCREIWEDYYGNEEELSIEAEEARQRLESQEDHSEGETDEGQQDIQTGKHWLGDIAVRAKVISGQRSATDMETLVFYAMFPFLDYYRQAMSCLGVNLRR